MIKPNCFDNIKGISFLSNICENYCSPGIISEKYGREFKIVSIKDRVAILELDPAKTSNRLCTIIFKIVHLLSYFTFFIPFCFFMTRSYLRGKYTFQLNTKVQNSAIISSPKNEHVKKIALAEKKLKELWDAYDQIQDLYPVVSITSIEENHHELFSSAPGPDQGLGNIITEFKQDPVVFFIPNRFYKNLKYGDDRFPDCLDSLKDILDCAFTTGKKIVVTRIGNNKHTIMAAFTDQGQVKVIDSMLNSTIDLQKLLRKLNDSKILNSSGEIIIFKGEYINTRIQKRGNDCMRFATLYAYQIAKKRSLDAYLEVDAAFESGQLKVFEDYKKIGNKGVQRVLSASETPFKLFMHSWNYRSAGFTVQRWQDIALKSLVDRSVEVLKHPHTYNKDNGEVLKNLHQIMFLVLSRNKILQHEKAEYCDHLRGFTVNSKDLDLIKEEDYNSSRVESISDLTIKLEAIKENETDEKVVLIFNGHNSPFKVFLKKDEEVYMILENSNGEKRTKYLA